MRKPIFLVLLAGLAFCGTAFGDDDSDGTKVDCSDTDLQFKDPDFKVQCNDLSRSSISLEEGVAGDRVKKLFALRQSGGGAFIVALDQSVLGTRVYMRHEDLEDEITQTFSKVSVTNWHSADDASGFKTATFTGDFDNGSQLECRAFRREMNRRYEGVGRRVYGIACGRGDSEALATLSKLDAPGD
jgi:hypothetical protein